MIIYWTKRKKGGNDTFLGEDSHSFINICSTHSDSLPSDNFSFSFKEHNEEAKNERFSFVKKVEEFERKNLLNGLMGNIEDFISLKENRKLIYGFMQKKDNSDVDKNKILFVLISKIDFLIHSLKGLEIIHKLLCILNLRDKKILVENMLNNIEYFVLNTDKEIFFDILHLIIKMNIITSINVILFSIVKNIALYYSNKYFWNIIQDLYNLRNDFVTSSLKLQRI